ncbi:SPOSA6832_00842 [Sporobolomyces salmonicolor]|uniref:Mediator of RNA polymerase II transcription subunit 17 n=1 Tax=Sporidiobolus salmonicolor TaxID=5005 RepID=A0A0D6EH19_SPOSA|nr:SPOSA6832_00842 [Sporobolomyces salmonicolor]
MPAAHHLSLEPLPVYANDGKDSDLFARPARLLDVVLEDGSEVFTRFVRLPSTLASLRRSRSRSPKRRADPNKSLQERLMRVWAERGDYSLVTEETIRNPPPEANDDDQVPDGRPSSEDMRKLQEDMLTNLSIARGELSTALDLLNVLSPATDPPQVDPTTLPLPHQTLTLVPHAVPPPPPSDPSLNPLTALPLATSLDALKSSANAFFRASEDLIPMTGEEDEQQGEAAPSSAKPRPRSRAPDPWPTILRLHATSARTLLPLGAAKGATLTGKGEARIARQVGVFYGCEEAKPEYRRAAIARVGELVGKDVDRKGGRRMIVEMVVEGRLDRVVWDEQEGEEGEDPVEKVLKARGRSAFAEELFAQVPDDRGSSTPFAESSAPVGHSLGRRFDRDDGSNVGAATNDGETSPRAVFEVPFPSVPTRPLPQVAPGSPKLSSPLPSPPPSSPASLISPLLRLLFLQTYASRRSPAPSASTRPLLAILSAVITYFDRLHALEGVLERAKRRVEDEGLEKVEVELWSGSRRVRGEGLATRAEEVVKVLEGAGELGGRVMLRIGKT